MDLFKSKKNLLLLVSSVIVWLGTCLLAMHWNTVYDGAIGGFPTYLWVFAPVALIFNIFMNSRPSNPDGRDHSRWAQALLVFLVALMAMIYYFTNADGGMTVQRLTVFFTFFVMLQFWNLFNARVFGTTDSAFKGLTKSYGMELIVLAILGGQFLIVQFGGAVFRTEPLDWQTWLIIIGSSSLVLWIGELIRLVKRLTQK